MYLRQQRQCLLMKMLQNVQYLFLEIMEVGIQGEIGRVMACAPW
jgi:hypothetical protein